jgi:hypothetical protein
MDSFFRKKFKATMLTPEIKYLNRKNLVEVFSKVLKYLYPKKHQEQTLFISSYHQSKGQAILNLYELPYKYEYGNVQFIRKIGIN